MQYNQVKRVGDARVRGAFANSPQSDIARFWPAGALEWNTNARLIVARKALDRWQHARLFALLNVSVADSMINNMESKYRYNFWRPVTAIRNGDIDGNDAKERDAGWLPFIDTPMHPEYPCAHCILSATVGTILEAEAGGEPLPELSTTSHMVEGVTRRWKSVDDFMAEVASARIYDGVHYRNSAEVGTAMGRQVGAWTAQALFEKSD